MDLLSASPSNTIKKEEIAMISSKLLEIVNINDEDDEITLIYEKIAISDIVGLSEENPIILEDEDEDYAECSNSKDNPIIILEEEDFSFYPRQITCEICVDQKPVHDMFWIKGCNHRYCSDCICKYIASRIDDNITNITCPVSECNGRLEPELCRDILPKKLFELWGDALCEALILTTQRFYCPFEDCSGLLIDEGDEVIKDSECQYCRRLFCAQCKVPWHEGINCKEFQKLDKDEREINDIKAIKFAESQNWPRCPKCRIIVERVDGCLFIKCRCGHTFCYSCGTYIEKDHYCPNCKRTWD